MKSTIISVTPEIAEKWLEKNPINRKVSDIKIRVGIAAMNPAIRDVRRAYGSRPKKREGK